MTTQGYEHPAWAGASKTGGIMKLSIQRGCLALIMQALIAMPFVCSAPLLAASKPALARKNSNTPSNPLGFTGQAASLNKAANSGNAEAQWRLSLLYAYGKDIPQNNTLALQWMRKSAMQGFAPGQHTLGLVYSGGLLGVTKDLVAAVDWYRKAAEQGYSSAQLNLGQAYLSGTGVAKSETTAAFWINKAAEQGDPEAQLKLGLLYSNGVGVPQNYKLGLAAYQSAAEQGNSDAMTGLGWHYQLGLGVPTDNVQSLMWFILAAARGDKVAIEQRDRMSNLMPPEQTEEAQNLALNWNSK